jgi:NDP-sugar pyrophosphorylase family protein
VEEQTNYFKVCILAAGIGGRMSGFSEVLNKALIPVNGKPAICHIIEKFSNDTEIIIATGYKKETIECYLNSAYPKRKITFKEVDKYEGPGTGPGYSLLQCKDYLQCPFIFFSTDTLVKEEIPSLNENWFGVSEVSDTSRFCSATIKDNKVIKIDDKIKSDNKHASIGLAGIKDYVHFWNSLESDTNVIAGEIQVSNGFKSLLVKNLQGTVFTWFDTGTPNSYSHALENFPNGEGYKGD